MVLKQPAIIIIDKVGQDAEDMVCYQEVVWRQTCLPKVMIYLTATC